MISRESRIKLKSRPNVTDLAGEKVMVDFSKGKYFMLKGVGNDIWDMLEDNIEVNTILNKIMEEYEVSEEECLATTLDFLVKLEELEFIEGIS